MADILPYIAALTQVAGVTSSIEQGNEMERLRQQQANRQKALYDKYNNLTPAAEAAGIQSFYNPLSAAFKKMVARDVGGTLAARGAAEAPGMMTEELAIALSPYEQQNLQNAQNAYFQSIGLPLRAAAAMSPAPAYPQGGPNISGAFASLAKLLSPNATPDTSGTVPPPSGMADVTSPDYQPGALTPSTGMAYDLSANPPIDTGAISAGFDYASIPAGT